MSSYEPSFVFAFEETSTHFVVSASGPFRTKCFDLELLQPYADERSTLLLVNREMIGKFIVPEGYQTKAEGKHGARVVDSSKEATVIVKFKRE